MAFKMDTEDGDDKIERVDDENITEYITMLYKGFSKFIRKFD